MRVGGEEVAREGVLGAKYDYDLICVAAQLCVVSGDLLMSAFQLTTNGSSLPNGGPDWTGSCLSHMTGRRLITPGATPMGRSAALR